MNLLFLSHTSNNPNLGATRIYYLLTDGLRARGHTVDLRHYEDFHPPRSRWAQRLVQRTVLPQWISHHAGRFDFAKYDLVMASSGMAYPLFRRLRARARRPVLVNHMHGLSEYVHLASLCESELGYYRMSLLAHVITGPFQRRWDHAGADAADLTVVQNLRDLGHVRFRHPDRPVSLLPAAVLPELLRASDTSASPAAREPGKLLWFASWEPRKGGAYVPAAFHEVRARYPAATLTIGGTGKSPEALRALFDPQDRAHVTVLPHITVEEQIALFNSHAIFLFPSLSEGFGLALPEAMCFGVAAVTTQTAFGGDHLRDGTNARVIYPSAPHLARALLELIGDDAGRVRLAEVGRDLARTFTAERMLTGYEQTFAEARERLDAARP